jgi:hypothetical protein
VVAGGTARIASSLSHVAAIPVFPVGCAGLATVNPCRLAGLLAEDDADAGTSRALPRNLVDAGIYNIPRLPGGRPTAQGCKFSGAKSGPLPLTSGDYSVAGLETLFAQR